ncbi:ribosomal protein bL36 [Catellatospora vulcania]|uniref:ribosomal protein bL36 n=1 Tax=Catellatospora vulcania TaxID=1460450 RepID=UPI0038B3E31F
MDDVLMMLPRSVVSAQPDHRASVRPNMPFCRVCQTGLQLIALTCGNARRTVVVVDGAERKGRCNMKVRSSLRSLKNRPNSIVVRRHGAVFVINKADPRQKTRQG